MFVLHIKFDDLDQEFDPELKEFVQTNCASSTLEEIQKDIENMEIKNIIKNTSYKISRFNLKLYIFVYDKLLEFPKSDITYDTITFNNFFKNVNQIFKVKIHLHHSHVTGEILGYVHDFCHLRVRENKTEFVVFAHNFFGFDMYFLLKEFRATACNSKI